MLKIVAFIVIALIIVSFVIFSTILFLSYEKENKQLYKKNCLIENYNYDINLSQTSAEMISFLNCDNYNYDDTNEQTKNVLKDFYLKFNNSISEINNLSIKDGFVEINKTLVKPKDFQIIPELLQNDINTNLIYQTVYKYNIFGKEITIYIAEENYNIEEYNECIRKILILFSMYLKYSTKKCSNSLSIFLFFSKLEKTLPEYGEQIERHNLNNAFTYPCVKNSELTIYRKEEWFKVFCHESMHNLGLDFSEKDDTISKELVLKIFPIKSNVRLYEAYTETWAKIMNCVFCSLYNFNDSFDNFIIRFNFLISKERVFVILQTVKILNYMGITYQDLYEENGNRDKYYEKTYLISYFVINSILLNNYQEFINWCEMNNVNILQFDNENHETKQTLLCKFIKDYHNTEMIIKRFNSMVDEYKKEKENKSYLMITLKKSIVEI